MSADRAYVKALLLHAKSEIAHMMDFDERVQRVYRDRGMSAFRVRIYESGDHRGLPDVVEVLADGFESAASSAEKLLRSEIKRMNGKHGPWRVSTVERVG